MICPVYLSVYIFSYQTISHTILHHLFQIQHKNGIRINKLNEIVTTQHAMIQDLRKEIDYYQHVVWRNNYRADDDDDDDASLDSPPSTSGLSTSTDGLSSDDDNEDDDSSCSRGIRSTLDSDGDSDRDSDGDSDSRFMPRKPLPLGIEYKDILFKHRSNHISRIATMPAGQPVIDLCDSD